MNCAGNAVAEQPVEADRPNVAVIHKSPTRPADHYRVTEDFPAMRTEIERQRQELDRCRATIVEMRRCAAQAAAAEGAKMELLAEISHELRTPLSAIIGFSEIMQSEAFGPIGNSTYRDYLDDIIFCGRHLLGVIDGALDLARHEAGRIPLKEEPVALGIVIEEAIRLIAPSAARAEVALAGLPADTKLPLLYCDRQRMRQILVNLLSNAVKFTEPGGRIDIAADLSDGVAVVITDTGIGIKPEDVPAALSRFGQIALSGSPSRGGAGLGLSLAKALAEQHGGTLLLQSAPDVGTIVRLSFPPGRIASGSLDKLAAGLPADAGYSRI